MATKKKEKMEKAGLRPASEITLENISQYEWEIYKRVNELVEALKDQQKETQSDSTTVRVGNLVVMRGKGYLKATPDFDRIWEALPKEEYAPKKKIGGAIKIDLLVK